MNDYTIYYGLTFLAFAISMAAQFYVRSVYSTYDRTGARRNISGAQAARELLDRNGMYEVGIRQVNGFLTDHYDPRSKEVRLSTNNYQGTSLANVTIACHECGHAIQDAESYRLLNIRSALIPAVNISSYAGYFAIMMGTLLGMLQIIWIGIVLEMVILLFQVITLPIEFDASARALKQIESIRLLDEDELQGGKKVLNAAALTYVAGVAATLLEILRLILFYGRRNDRRR
ncbi:MAG: zinc metallopeptidase [Erysipelotrichaceae bacterium]|nr:zinc metallopeptidase [Erysipelotrichaceae bacterium]